MTTWRRSSRCEQSNCVEVAARHLDGVRVRDSERPEVNLTFGGKNWNDFVTSVKAGRLA
ncbi:DUF397 domain-containing protein [Plantactinospora sp. CA-290183]|uniref:DUF397 domain-containing protein n=1 Tax=Plantactinospora sp. CA-290183 TaxID=3240006 RepID=UPI003D8C580D